MSRITCIKCDKEYAHSYITRHKCKRNLAKKTKALSPLYDFLLTLPDDLIYYIALYFSGYELLNVLTVNTNYFRTFSPEKSSHTMLHQMWCQQTTYDLANHPHSNNMLKTLAPINNALHCSRYLSLLYKTDCEICHKTMQHRIYSPLLLRACTWCIEKVTVDENVLERKYGIDLLSITSLPFFERPIRGNVYLIYRVYLREQIEHHLGRSLDSFLVEKKERDRVAEKTLQLQKQQVYDTICHHPLVEKKWNLFSAMESIPSTFDHTEIDSATMTAEQFTRVCAMHIMRYHFSVITTSIVQTFNQLNGLDTGRFMFRFHERSITPLMIDYILDKSNCDKLLAWMQIQYTAYQTRREKFVKEWKL